MKNRVEHLHFLWVMLWDSKNENYLPLEYAPNVVIGVFASPNLGNEVCKQASEHREVIPSRFEKLSKHEHQEQNLKFVFGKCTFLAWR